MILARNILAGATLLATLGGGQALAEHDLPMPAPRNGDVLRIPGLPPIQLPPGARAFGPLGPTTDEDGTDAPSPRAEPPRPEAPRRAGKKPDRRPPVSTPSVQSQRARVLDDLFRQLKTASDERNAQGVAGAIERVWLRSGSDTADILMGRAAVAMAQKDLSLAETLLDSIIEIEPDWAEAWNKRATVRFLRDDYDGSIADIERTLKLEPRHYGALAGLGAILQKSDLDKRALEAYRHALDVYPEQPELRKLVEKLGLEIEGRDI